jgi:hypothetical protein
MGTARVASHHRWLVLPVAILGLLVNGTFCCGGLAAAGRMLVNHPNHPEKALGGALIFVGAGLGVLFCGMLLTANARVETRPGELELQRRVLGLRVSRTVVSTKGVRSVQVVQEGRFWATYVGDARLGIGAEADAERLAEAVHAASGLPISR